MPKNGLKLEWFLTNSEITHSVSASGKLFEIRPSQLSDDLLLCDANKVRISGYFETNKRISDLVVYSNHGTGTWQLDGTPIASIRNGDSNRYLYIKTKIDPGAHQIIYESSDTSPPSHIYAASVNQDRQSPVILSPVFPNPLRFGAGARAYILIAAYTALYAALFLLLPRINAILKNLQRLRLAKPLYLFVIVLLAGSYALQHGGHFIHSVISGSRYEADEAAFGIMAQRLIAGEAPPLFHYGQAYQGTIEVYPLAFLIAIFGTHSIHWLSVLFCIVFIIITVVSSFRFGSIPLGFFTIAVLTLSGSHFYWIGSKAWFGYSYSLASGSIMMFIALEVWRQKWLSPGLALIWGMLAGSSLYELPISIPFVASSFFMIVYSVFNNKTTFPKIKSSISSFLLLIISCSLFLLPYLPGPTNSDAARFLSEGRNLPETRIENEDPLFERFLGECLPVLLGGRTPYDQQHFIQSVMLPYLPSLLLFFSFLFLPFGPIKPQIEFSTLFLRMIFFFFSIFTILLVCFSPFGVWPWYAIALYWIAPFSLYLFFKFVWQFSPALTFVLGAAYFISMLSASNFDSVRLANPTSLSLDGIVTKMNFDEIIQQSKQHEIDSLICDTGYDSTPIDAGRDWLGECITFASNGNITGVDRLSRRLPSLAYQTMQKQSVGYLFDDDFYYNNPSLESSVRYIPLTMDSLIQLFGANGLDFQRYQLDGYNIFLPKRSFNKASWKVASNNHVFLDAAYDNNISVRGYGRHNYWSSGEIPMEGGWLEVDFPDVQTFKRAVLFHGTKKFDYLHENKVKVRDNFGVWYDVGSFKYNQTMRSSVLTLENAAQCNAIRIEYARPPDNSWLTIFEMWFF